MYSQNYIQHGNSLYTVNHEYVFTEHQHWKYNTLFSVGACVRTANTTKHRGETEIDRKKGAR